MHGDRGKDMAMHMGAGEGRGPAGMKLLETATAAAQAPLSGARPDLGVLFVTNHFENDMADLAAELRQRTGVKTLIGCTAEGVVGPVHELEREPALTVWLAHLPGALIEPFHLSQSELEALQNEEPDARPLPFNAATTSGVLLLGDPFSVDINALLEYFNEAFPKVPVIGGMASGVEAPEQSALVLDDDVHREGVVGVALGGALALSSIVSQGCRPIGRPYVITKAERNVIQQLGGRVPLQLLNEIFAEAPQKDQQLMQQGILLGRAISEQKSEFHRGDFLIRNLLGADPSSGAIAVGDLVRVGITVQFHVRDAATADEDLRALLAPHAAAPPAGALLFSCNGRGSRMFPAKGHDVNALKDSLGAIPTAGFFCAGELGPVGGKNFIHGHTASIALFHAKS